MLKVIHFSLIFLCLVKLNSAKSQAPFLGVWKGVVYSNSLTDSSAKIVYIKISKYKSICDLNFRIEKLQSTSFYASKLTGTYNSDSLIFKDVVFDQKSMINISKAKCCMKITVNDSTGYLSVEIIKDKETIPLNKMILYEVKEEFVSTAKKEVNQAWFYLFQKEYQLGMLAPQKREEERTNFQFKSIYFQPAKADLSPDDHSYLKKLINVVNGHTDLRLKVIGHTDWDGSDQYNENLSKKRAEAIIQFLEQNGLARDRIEYEYQGEKKPVDTNKTSEGKKRNRRVDFQFI
ncbi:MAG: OmpA family protein [Bacteroidota bacterium]